MEFASLTEANFICLIKKKYMKLINLFIAVIYFCLVAISNPLVAQESKYYPKGNPEKWNVELNPFVWLPVVSGTFFSEMLSENTTIPAIDLVSNLKFAFMINADVSKGKFFASPSYIYTKLGTDKVNTIKGIDTITAHPELTMNIFELIAGVRLPIGDKVYMDPYLGFRYTSYHVYANFQGSLLDSSKIIDETANYWDPVLGLRVHYYPHPRVPLTFKSDIGGFGAGSTFSWTVSINGGYTLSPTVDLMAGFTAYGSDFVQENPRGNDVGLKSNMYGFDIGIKVMIPARYKDPAIFKKKAK